MPIADMTTPGTPGWWLKRGSTKLRNQFERLDDLINRSKGQGPLVHGADPKLYEAYCSFQKKARANWAGAIVRARKERIELVGFATEADSDADGDRVSDELALKSRLYAEFPKAVKFALVCDSGPMVIGMPNGYPIVTAEDPRQIAVFRDPIDRSIRAAMKVYADVDYGRHYAHLFLRDEVDGRVEVRQFVAFREFTPGTRVANIPSINKNWDWDEDFGGAEGRLLPLSRVPVVELTTGDGSGVFEEHIDVLDRIDHETLQGLVIVAMQAYKQRALINLPDKDEDGNDIDWDGLLQPGPGAVWQLPEGVELKEFSEAELSSILNKSRDTLRQLSDLTATPLRASVQDSANQTAEGATFAREGLIFATDDFKKNVSGDVAEAQALSAEWLQDTARDDATKITPLWSDSARRSLIEMADADSKSQKTLSHRQRLVRIWGMKPSEAQAAYEEWQQEQRDMLDAQFAASFTTAFQSQFGTPAVTDTGDETEDE